MSKLRYIVPDRCEAEHVESDIGKELVCPFCQSQSTGAKGNEDTTWVETPLRKSPPKWICLGCCIDIYSTCLSEDFNDHPFKSIVEDAANLARVDLHEFRYICVQHQLEIAEMRFSESKDSRYSEAIQRIQRLITSFEEDTAQ